MKGIKALRYITMLVAVLALFQVNAFAEIIRGEIKAVNQNEQSITINQLDQAGIGVTRKNLELNLRDDTQFTGIRSIQELKVGDEVLIEANKKIFGPWVIKHLQSANMPNNPKAADLAVKSIKTESVKIQSQAQQMSPQKVTTVTTVQKMKPDHQTPSANYAGSAVTPAEAGAESPKGLQSSNLPPPPDAQVVRKTETTQY